VPEALLTPYFGIRYPQVLLHQYFAFSAGHSHRLTSIKS
jgi:hypothetical protein